MSIMDSLGVHLGPVHVAGRGLVTPKGWVSPETRALMQKAQDDCDRAAAAREASDQQQKCTLHDCPEDVPSAASRDPWGDMR